MIDTKYRALIHQTAITEYDAPCAFDLDEVFYRVERVESKYFYDPCKVCGGEGTLTINEVTFNCPCCDKQKVSTTINMYAVRRYRVYAITEEKSTLEWKPEKTSRVRVKLYRKIGHGYSYSSSQGSFEIFPRDTVLNVPYDATLTENNLNTMLYTDYALACKVANAFVERELARLAEINAERGTNYAVEFKQNNDPRSN